MVREMCDQALTLKEIHEETIGLIKKVIAICDELKINYFMAYGSLLGVIRHQGFIPWDDDTDIVMLRPAYDKFKQYCLENEKNLYPYKLMGWENTKDYPFGLYRFCDTRYRMESWDYPDAGMGLFIDIYCYDGAGNDLDAISKIYKKNLRWTKFTSLAVSPAYKRSQKGFIGNFIKFPAYLYAKMMGPKHFIKKLDKAKNSFSFEDSKYLNSMTWDTSINSRNKEWYQEFVYMPLHDIQVKVPKRYDEVLRCSYGDYMKLPPEEQRVPSHGYKLYRKSDF